jgi:mRNA interferase RelE/StbE
MDTVTIPRAEYDALIAAREELEELSAFDRAVERGEESVPAAFVDRMLNGESLVRLWREHRGLSQSGLAAAAGVHRVNLNKIESGHSGASIDTLGKIAAALDVTVDDLIQ